MVEKETLRKSMKYYAPDAQVVNHIQRRLQLSNTLKNLSDGEQIPKKIEREKAALSTQKTRILNEKIFQAMTDLTFFFGAVGKHTELQLEFNDDIKELLGVRRDNPKSTEYGFTFSALVGGMLLAYSGRTEKDFRLRLTHDLQRIIWSKISQYMFKVFESEYTQNSISHDFGRVIGWTEMLMFASDKDEYRIPEVVPVHRKEYGGPTREEKERIEESRKPYEKDLKRKSPHRTFDFSSVANIIRI
jgi:hypothetical protein